MQNILSDTCDYWRVRATRTGRRARRADFIQHQIVEVSTLLAVTVTIPNAFDTVYNFAMKTDPNCRFRVVKPNAVTSQGFTTQWVAKRFQIVAIAKLCRGYFPINFLAVEFGSNFDILVAVRAIDAEIVRELRRELSTRFEMSETETATDLGFKKLARQDNASACSSHTDKRAHWLCGRCGNFACGNCHSIYDNLCFNCHNREIAAR